MNVKTKTKILIMMIVKDPENCKQYFVCEQGTPQSAVCEVKVRQKY